MNCALRPSIKSELVLSTNGQFSAHVKALKNFTQQSIGNKTSMTWRRTPGAINQSCCYYLLQEKIKHIPTTPVRINLVILLFVRKLRCYSDPHARGQTHNWKSATTRTDWSSQLRIEEGPRCKHGLGRFCSANLALSRRTLRQDKVKQWRKFWGGAIC